MNAYQLNEAKLIKIIDEQAGKLEEVHLGQSAAPLTEPRMPMFNINGQRHGLVSEAVAQAYFKSYPSLLKDGLRSILFSEYGEVPNTHGLWIDEVRSNKPDEQWIEGSHLPGVPKVAAGANYSHVGLNLDRTLKISNDKRGYIFDVAREDILFDRTNLVVQTTQDLARAMMYQEEVDAYAVMTATGNYVRTTADGDNDIGNNTATTTFSATGLITALTTLRTMKDRKSGRRLGIRPSMLVCGVGVEIPAVQLLMSPVLDGMGDTSSVIRHGTGTSNPFRGTFSSIVVSPELGQYEWAVLEPRRPIVKQVVWDLDLVQTDETNEPWFNRDVISFKVSKYYGVGMKNDRFIFFSDSTSQPTVT